MDAAPAATEDVRRRNTAAVLRLLRDSGPASRADLARLSGLAKATVGTIVGHLQQLGAVAEATASPAAGRGRPSTPVELDGRSHAGLGIEVNVDYVAVTALDLAGRELWFEERPRTSATMPVEQVVALAREQLDRARGQGLAPLGLTVAVPGLIDRAAGRVVQAPNLGWDDVPLAALLTDALGDDPGSAEVAVSVDNDANCAVRAESLRGVAAGTRDLVYLTGTVGLGAGILAEGRVLRGSRGLAGEVGHLRVGTTQPCACGREGCWEALAGQRALVAASGLEVDPGEDPVGYARRLAGLPDAETLLRPVTEAMERGVAALVLGLDPSVVVLGGAFVPLGDVLVPALERSLARGFTGPGVRVALSSLGLHAASVGAALDALDDVYAGRRSLPAR
ncbi:Sugar kinase of the NBD/HSP70 family, may contain an N-terminal HTH domain [Nocardioides scoriae]|uniref:Sugar kinase of the NBD/HSP70 family, may contain an N-terminal HTH domain n=1 Tax=Nocardioides scoriae TaxID=642780 RepID=A0A1H1RU59_9ACTN|nr:ROK family protein [Nocardioides scoriae]SDS39271.1 Sugar kinase of the NBD/HSP70 family, may contain an N-terminal HTH domain [Nocardioides scoriae]